MVARRGSALWLLGLLAALSLACSESESGGPTRVRVGRDGGRLQVDGALLEIPAGALDETVEISMLASDLGAPEIADRVRVSRVFQVSPQELRLLAPARLTITYQAERFPEGIPPTAAEVRRTDFTLALERLGSGRVDEAAGSVSGETLSLGTFWAVAPSGPRPAWVEVSPAEHTLYQGETVELAARVRDQNELPLDAQVAWTSSDPLVASVDEAGKVSALVPGIVEITAQAGAAQGKARIKVASTAPFARQFGWENPVPQGNALHAAGGDAENLLVAGASGTVARRGADGAWSVLHTEPGLELAAVAALGAGVLAAGARDGVGVLLQLQDGAATEVRVPGTALTSLWTDGVRAVAVGEGPDFATRGADGAWSVEPTPVTEQLLAGTVVEGRVRVVGARGAVYERQGEAWAALEAGPLPQIQIAAVWRGAEAFAISRSALRRWGPEGWTQVALPSMFDLTLRAIGLAGAALAVTATDAQGNGWVLIESENGFVAHPLWPEALDAVWGRSPSDVYAVAQSGAVYAWEGTHWSNLREGLTVDVVSLAAFPGGEVFAAANRCRDADCLTGEVGVVLRREGNGRFWELEGPFSAPLQAIAGRSADDLWAVGGTVTYRWQGQGWSVGSAPVPLHALAVCGDMVFAAGVGALFREVQGAWQPMWQGGYSALRAVGCGGGTVFAAGDYSIVRYAGAKATVLDPTDDGIRSTVWRAVSVMPEGRAFIGGDARYILFWNGAKFEYFDMPGGLEIASVRALWGTGFGNLWAAGMLGNGRGFVLHFDGARWESIDPLASSPIDAMAGLDDGQVWIGGAGGALLRAAPPAP